MQDTKDIDYNLPAESFIEKYQTWAKDSIEEIDRHNKALYEISEKHNELLEILNEKVLFKLNDLLNESCEKFNDWLENIAENHPEKIVETEDGKHVYFNKNTDETPDNMHLLKLLDEDLAISFEPVGRELIQVNLYFEESKRLEEHVFKVIDLANLVFPDGYFDEIAEEQDS